MTPMIKLVALYVAAMTIILFYFLLEMGVLWSTRWESYMVLSILI